MKKIFLSLLAAAFMLFYAGICLDRAEAVLGTNFVETYSKDKDGNRVIIRKYTDGSLEQITYAGNKVITVNKYTDGASDKQIKETINKNTEIITKFKHNGAITKIKSVDLGNGKQHRKVAVKKKNGNIETYEQNVETLSDGRMKRTVKKPDGYICVELITFSASGSEVIKELKEIKYPDGKTEKVQSINQTDGTRKIITTNADGTQNVEIVIMRRI